MLYYLSKYAENKSKKPKTYTGSFIWKSLIQPSVLETSNDFLALSLVLNHSVGWALLLSGKKFNI